MSRREAEQPDRADMVGVFFHSWAVGVRRGQGFAQDRLMIHLLNSADVGTLTVAQPFRSRFAPLARVLRGARDAPRPERERRTIWFEPRRIGRADPTDLTSLRRLYRRYGAELGKKQRAANPPDVIVTHPLAAGLGDFSWARSVTYYATDDWSESPAQSAYRDAFLASYAGVREKGHGVVAVSPQIVDAINPTGRTMVLPNGVNADLWADPGAPPEWFHKLRRPVGTYVATIDGRLDAAAVRSVAKTTLGTVLLVGPVADGDVRASLADLRNVVFTERMGAELMAATVRSSDVALMPHRETPFTRAMSPLKVYEGLAAGIPVVATDLPPVRGISDRVLLVSPGGDFATAIERAMTLPRESEQSRLAFLDANSWERRHDRLLAFARGRSHAQIR